MTFEECKKSLKNVMEDENGYPEYASHHLKTVWNAAIESAAVKAEDTMEYLSSPLAPYNQGVMDTRHAIAEAIRAL